MYKKVLSLSFLIPIISLLTFCHDSDELYKHGTIGKAKVVKRRSFRVPRSGSSYDVTIRFWHNSRRHTRLLSVNEEDYKRCYVGAEVDIIFLKRDLQVVKLLDYKRYYNTKERILLPEDLISFDENRNVDSILLTLNKISHKWSVIMAENIVFINHRRNEVLILFKDSISYYSHIFNMYQIKDELAKFGRYKRTKIKSGLLTIPPFDTIPLSQINKRINAIFEFDCQTYFTNNYEFSTYQQVDRSSKAWIQLNCKRRKY